jgi:hypothetical protein
MTKGRGANLRYSGFDIRHSIVIESFEILVARAARPCFKL